MKKLNNQKLKNFIWHIIGTGFNSIISLFFLIIVTRINGVEIAGEFSLCYSVALIIYVLLLFGNRNYQSTDVKEYSDNEYLCAKCLSIIIGIIITFFWCLIFNYGINKSAMLLILVLYKSIDAFSESIYAIFQKRDKLDYVGISYFMKSMLILMLFLIFNIVTKNILYASLGIFAGDLIIFIFYDLKKVNVFYKVKITFNFAKSLQILNITKYVFLFSLLMTLMVNVPRLFTDYYLSDYYLGYYSIIIMLPTVFSLLGQFIIQPELVKYTKLFYDKKYKELDKLIFKTNMLMLILCLIIFIFFFFFGTYFFEFLYKLKFDDFKNIIILSLISGIFNIFSAYFSAILTVFRKTKEQFILYLTAFVIELILSYILIRQYTLTGIFFAYFITMLFQLLGFIFIYIKENKKIKERKL